MDTHAQHVVAACQGATAYTLAGGYAVHAAGSRALFQPCRVEKERRNDKGRVTFLRGSYPDGSAVEFRYHPNRGASLRVAS